MHKFNGQLYIRAINGSRGTFHVGRLVTEIGEFAVKNSAIDEFEPGRYDGEFGVTRIFPSHYVAAGRLVVEVRADVATISLVDVDTHTPVPQLPVEDVDPATEVQSVSAPADVVVPQNTETSDATPGLQHTTGVLSVAPVKIDDTNHPHQVQFEDLFGELWPLQARVKLDPTVDRVRFRAQRDALRTLGYRFVPVGQVWEMA